MRFAYFTLFPVVLVAVNLIINLTFAKAQTLDDIPKSGSIEIVTVPKEMKNQIMSLDIPEMIYPPNGASEVPIVPGFVLKTVENADRYELQVSTSESFDCGFFYCDIISNAYWEFLEPLPPDSLLTFFPGISSVDDWQNSTTYYWRVRALAEAGQQVSDWSQPFSYTTTGPRDPVSPPGLISPDQNSVLNWGPVELIWDQSSRNPNWYQVQLTESSSFSGFEYSWRGNDNLSAIFDTKWNRTYYWRVVAFNDHSISEFSNVGQFETTNLRILTDSEGEFDDGSGPKSNYENGLDVLWRIQPENASNIVLSFLSFDTEEGYDFVTIYDGETTDSPILGKFSGNTIPGSLVSSQGVLLVRFTTDGSVTGAGWSAEYFSEPRSVFQWPVDDVSVAQVYACRDCISSSSQRYMDGINMHTGVDLGGERKTIVKAAADGKVVKIYGLAGESDGIMTPETIFVWNDANGDRQFQSGEEEPSSSTGLSTGRTTSNHGLGITIIVQHPNGKYSLYGHLDAVRKDIYENVLVQGQSFPVYQGEAIGLMGFSEFQNRNSDKIHVHFE
ncbi:MAG: CUB domain-containing protein, partial [bacterium]